MAYDNFCMYPKSEPPCRHATNEFAAAVVQLALAPEAAGIKHKMTLGIPFYGRDMYMGKDITYSEIMARNKLLTTSDNEVFI